MAVVTYEGDVLWLPAAIFRSTCSVNILYFPFDIQNCSLKFGSWTYDGWKLDIDFHHDVGEVVRIMCIFSFFSLLLLCFFCLLFCLPSLVSLKLLYTDISTVASSYSDSQHCNKRYLFYANSCENNVTILVHHRQNTIYPYILPYLSYCYILGRPTSF